jgi:hypothetical protein
MSDIVTAPFQDPMESFQKGINFGSGIRKMQAEAQAAEEAKKQAAAKAAAEADRQARLSDFNSKLRSGTVTPQDYMIMSQDMSKDQNEAFQAGWKMLDSQKQDAALKDTGELFAAFQSGNTDLALSMMDNHIKALENSGNAQQAQAMSALRDAAKVDPQAVGAYFGTTLGRMGEGGKTVLENALKLQREDGQNTTAAGISLTQAQTREANARTQDLLDKSLEAKKTGGLAPDQVIAKEAELRQEFYGRQKAYIEADRNLSNIRDSAKDASGAGDVALVTSFMKMLDPGSVVRETEFANARDTAGLLGQLRSMATKVQNGQFLTPEQRASFARLAEKYMAPVQSRKENDTRTFKRIVNNYGLNWENVANVEEAKPQQGSTMGQGGADYLAGLKAFLKQNNPGAEAKIDAATSLTDLSVSFPNGVKTYEGRKGPVPSTQPVREVSY